MDSINQNQPEDNKENLISQEAWTKIKEQIQEMIDENLDK